MIGKEETKVIVENSILLKLRNKEKMKKFNNSKFEICLKSEKKRVYKKFYVFDDQQIGMNLQNQKLLLKTNQDEDNSSSDELISSDILRGIRVLKQQPKKE